MLFDKTGGLGTHQFVVGTDKQGVIVTLDSFVENNNRHKVIGFPYCGCNFLGFHRRNNQKINSRPDQLIDIGLLFLPAVSSICEYNLNTGIVLARFKDFGIHHFTPGLGKISLCNTDNVTDIHVVTIISAGCKSCHYTQQNYREMKITIY